MCSRDITGCEFFFSFRTCATYLDLKSPEILHFHDFAGCQLHLHLADQCTEHIQHVTVRQGSGIRNFFRHFVHGYHTVGLRLGIIHFLCRVISRLCAHQSKRILYTHLFNLRFYNLRFGCASKSRLTLPFAKRRCKSGRFLSERIVSCVFMVH
ncbi:hypothetical protein BACCAC_00745 [Bacteroides caccae ATCC 43185]|nr:hypothetical protein BACCAC_00745 [Bacteroides caccae ATCC 43185]